MKIAHYIFRNKESYGVIREQTVLPLPALAKFFKTHFPPRLEDFIAEGNVTLQEAEKMLVRKGVDKMHAQNQMGSYNR